MPCVMYQDTLRELRILIVDDNAGDRFLYKQMLLECDPGTRFHFIETDCASHAQELMCSEVFDCVLLDYVLPDMKGLELLKKLSKQQDLSVPVVMLTGFGDEATAVSALQNGAHGYISKHNLEGKTLSKAINAAISANKQFKVLDESRQENENNCREIKLKYEQIEGFYQNVVKKIKISVSSLRDQLSEVVNAQDLSVNRQVQKQLWDIKIESDRLLVSLNNLMDDPDLGVGHLLISPRPESIVDLVSETANSFRSAADSAGVRLLIGIQPGLPEVSFDRYRIEQVLINLLDNAIKFTPPNGRVFLTVNCLVATPDVITVAVNDTGCGIHADQIDKIFDRDAHSITEPGGSPGLGLGLYVCKEIIHSHNGRISVKSSPGMETSFTFTLPLENSRLNPNTTWDHVNERAA